MRTTSLVLSLSMLSASLTAQAPAPPSEQLAKYDRLLGHWEGKGTVAMVPGEPAAEWTSTVTAKKALGGHFIHEDVKVEFGEAMPGSLVFRNFYGFDRENNVHKSWGINNMGQANETLIHWVDDDTLLTLEVTSENGERVVERWTTKLGTDEYSILGQRSIGTGDWLVHVKGTYKRVQTGQPIDTSGSFGPPTPDSPIVVAAEKMKTLQKLAGTYKVSGTMRMPGQPEVAITGTERLSLICGGTVLEMRVTGTAEGWPPYESWGAIAWNADDNCFTAIGLSNMGQVGHSQGRWVGTDFVFTNASLQHGQPSVSRMLWRIGKNGIVKMEGDSLVATHEPLRAFEASYTRQPGVEPARFDKKEGAYKK